MRTRLQILFVPATLLLIATMSAEAQPEPQGTFAGGVGGAAGGLAYRLYLPAGGGRGRPLLVMLHGCTQTAADFAAGTRMNDWAARRSFSVLYPEQSPQANAQRCWSWFDPAHQGRDVGESARIAALTREITLRESADPDRVFIAGMSAGAAMALVVAANHPELYQGVASHSGIAVGAATDLRSALSAMRGGSTPPAEDGAGLLRAMGPSAAIVRLISFQGTADPVVHAGNADRLVRQWTAALGRLSSSELEVERGEAAGPQPGAAIRTTWRSGDRPLVAQWTIPELGHAWSGGSPEGSYTSSLGPDASEEIVRFFLGPVDEGAGS